MPVNTPRIFKHKTNYTSAFPWEFSLWKIYEMSGNHFVNNKDNVAFFIMNFLCDDNADGNRTSSLFLGKNMIVGKDETLTSSTSLAVESILATTMSERSSYFSPSSSQIGASCLQWPHHGASDATTNSSILLLYSRYLRVQVFYYFAF